MSDGIFANQSVESFADVGAAKVQGTQNLDKVMRKLCKETLQFFVVFSSYAAGYGNAGQTNYGYANSYMERLCESRNRYGLPGI